MSAFLDEAGVDSSLNQSSLSLSQANFMQGDLHQNVPSYGASKALIR